MFSQMKKVYLISIGKILIQIDLLLHYTCSEKH